MDKLHIFITILLLLCVVFVGDARAEGIFTPADSPSARMAGPVDGKSVSLRNRLVTLDAGALFSAKRTAKGEPVVFNLFDDVSVRVTPERTGSVGDGSSVFVGRNEEQFGGRTRVANTGGVLHGIVRTKGYLLYEITHQGDGVYLVEEIDQRGYPDELPPVVDDTPVVSPRFDAQVAPRAAPAPGDTTQIDVMILYTDAARAEVGGAQEMESLIALAVDETNEGFLNSNVLQEYRLVHSAEVEYNQGSDINTIISDLRGENDGQMDAIHALRNEYGADLVTLLVDNSVYYCGIGYQPLYNPVDYLAFTAVNYICATGYYSYAHETGHNQGVTHDRDNSSVDPIETYGYGYQQLDGDYRTIMAYGNQPRVNYWSNPEVEYSGLPTGVDYTANDSADASRSLNLHREEVAAFRDTMVVEEPEAPADDLLLMMVPIIARQNVVIP